MEIAEIASKSEDWFRLTALPVNRANKNQCRAEMLGLWRDVLDALKEWATSGPEEELRPLAGEQVDVSQLFKQMIGLGRTAAQYQGRSVKTRGALMGYIAENLERLLGPYKAVG